MYQPKHITDVVHVSLALFVTAGLFTLRRQVISSGQLFFLPVALQHLPVSPLVSYHFHTLLSCHLPLLIQTNGGKLVLLAVACKSSLW